MSGSGRRVFQPGEVLTASNVQNYLQDQAVQYYAGTAARGSAIGTATTEGMMSYLADTNTVQMATGTATWVNVDGVPIVAGTAARDALYPSPVQGNVVFRSDKGWNEQYFGLYNSSTNPGGANAAGWFPISGKVPFALPTKTGNQTISSSLTAVTFDALTDANDITLVSNTRFTVGTTGLYHVAVQATVNNTSVGTIQIRVNGGTSYATSYATNRSGASSLVTTIVLKLSATSYIEVMAQSDGAYPVTFCSLQMKYLEPLQS